MRGHTLRAHQPSEMGLKPRAFADQRFYRVQSEQLLVTQKSCALSELAVEGEGDEWCSGPCRPCGGDRVAPLGLRRRRQHHRRDTRLDLIDRKSVVSGKSVSVRVDSGGRRIIRKKHETE